VTPATRRRACCYGRQAVFASAVGLGCHERDGERRFRGATVRVPRWWRAFPARQTLHVPLHTLCYSMRRFLLYLSACHHGDGVAPRAGGDGDARTRRKTFTPINTAAARTTRTKAKTSCTYSAPLSLTPGLPRLCITVWKAEAVKTGGTFLRAQRLWAGALRLACGCCTPRTPAPYAGDASLSRFFSAGRTLVFSLLPSDFRIFCSHSRATALRCSCAGASALSRWRRSRFRWLRTAGLSAACSRTTRRGAEDGTWRHKHSAA